MTVVTGLLAKYYGPVFGGLFLAFPAIFPASATLVDKHERQKKQRAGIKQTTRGRQVAGVDAAGAALGSLGLATFAYVMWKLLPVRNIAGFYCGGRRLVLRFGDALVASQKALGSLVKMNDWAYFRELFNIFRKLSLVESVVSTSKLIFMSSSASRWLALWAPRHNRKEHRHPGREHYKSLAVDKMRALVIKPARITVFTFR